MHRDRVLLSAFFRCRTIELLNLQAYTPQFSKECKNHWQQLASGFSSNVRDKKYKQEYHLEIVILTEVSVYFQLNKNYKRSQITSDRNERKGNFFGFCCICFMPRCWAKFLWWLVQQVNYFRSLDLSTTKGTKRKHSKIEIYLCLDERQFSCSVIVNDSNDFHANLSAIGLARVSSRTVS